MRRDFPLYNNFNMFIDNLVEGGFVMKWIKEETEQHKNVVMNPKGYLNFRNIKYIFFMMMVVTLVCFIVFLLELAVYYL